MTPPWPWPWPWGCGEPPPCFSPSRCGCGAASAESPRLLEPLRHDSRVVGNAAAPAAMSAGDALRIEKASTLSMAADQPRSGRTEWNGTSCCCSNRCVGRASGFLLCFAQGWLFAEGRLRGKGVIYWRGGGGRGKKKDEEEGMADGIGVAWPDGSRRFARRVEPGGPRTPRAYATTRPFSGWLARARTRDARRRPRASSNRLAVAHVFFRCRLLPAAAALACVPRRVIRRGVRGPARAEIRLTGGARRHVPEEGNGGPNRWGQACWSELA